MYVMKLVTEAQALYHVVNFLQNIPNTHHMTLTQSIFYITIVIAVICGILGYTVRSRYIAVYFLQIPTARLLGRI